MSPVARMQANESDIISFHNYGWPEQFEKVVMQLEQLDRPLLCTEYMARGAGSTFDTILPIAYKHHVGAINWGFVVGKSQTNLPGIHGTGRTFSRPQPCGSTTSSTPTASPIASAR